MLSENTNNDFKYIKPSKYIPPLLEERMKIGYVKPNDIDKYFPLDKREIERYLKSHYAAMGNCGIIFTIEDCLLNLNDIYIIAFQYYIESLYGYKESMDLSKAKIIESIGRPFREAMASIGYPMSKITDQSQWKLLEDNFYQIFDKTLQSFPISTILPNSGVIKLLNDAIVDSNNIIIATALPKYLAIKLLEKANLINYLKGRVDPNHLLCFNEIIIPNSLSISYNNINYNNILMKSCYLLQMNPSIVLYISSNSKNILTAKRLGLNALAIKGNSMNPHELRVADKVVNSLEEIKIKDIYKILYNQVIMSQGPALQPQVTMSPSRIKLKSVSTPGLTREKDEKDTFAEEFGSDLN